MKKLIEDLDDCESCEDCETCNDCRDEGASIENILLLIVHKIVSIEKALKTKKVLSNKDFEKAAEATFEGSHDILDNLISVAKELDKVEQEMYEEEEEETAGGEQQKDLFNKN